MPNCFTVFHRWPASLRSSPRDNFSAHNVSKLPSPKKLFGNSGLASARREQHESLLPNSSKQLQTCDGKLVQTLSGGRMWRLVRSLVEPLSAGDAARGRLRGRGRPGTSAEGAPPPAGRRKGPDQPGPSQAVRRPGRSAWLAPAGLGEADPGTVPTTFSHLGLNSYWALPQQRKLRVLPSRGSVAPPTFAGPGPAAPDTDMCRSLAPSVAFIERSLLAVREYFYGLCRSDHLAM